MFALTCELVEAAFGVGLVGRVGQHILALQFFGDELVNGFDVFSLFGFKSMTASAASNLFHDLLAINDRLGLASLLPPPPPGYPPPAARVSATSTGIADSATAIVAGKSERCSFSCWPLV